LLVGLVFSSLNIVNLCLPRQLVTGKSQN